MGENSKIAWCHHTWNPWWGCVRVSPGCDRCYADALAKRTGHGDIWDTDKRRYFGDKHWNEPLKWNRKAEQEGIRYRVFCASMADVFDNVVEDKWRIRLFELTKATPHLDWLLLTKRIGNVPKMLPADWGDGYPNVWMGATVVNQEEADRDVPKLFDVAARLRWLSVEPQLGPIVMGDDFAMVDWVVYGGESGSLEKVRPFNIEWARDGIRQCQDAGIACYVKQMGARTFMDPKDGAPLLRTFSHADAADPEKWPSDIRVQEFPKGAE